MKIVTRRVNTYFSLESHSIVQFPRIIHRVHSNCSSIDKNTCYNTFKVLKTESVDLLWQGKSICGKVTPVNSRGGGRKPEEIELPKLSLSLIDIFGSRPFIVRLCVLLSNQGISSVVISCVEERQRRKNGWKWLRHEAVRIKAKVRTHFSWETQS